MILCIILFLQLRFSRTAIMKTDSHSISVMISFVMVISFAYLVSSSPIESASGKMENFPTGQFSPEGASCDLIRAYISQNLPLFHQRRCKQFCENKYDHEKAYKTFIEYKPIILEEQSSGLTSFVRPKQIIKIHPVQPQMSVEETNMKQTQLLFEDGACESRYFDITTVTGTGEQYRTRVEAVQIGKYGNSSNKHHQNRYNNLLPTGVWKARIINMSTVQSDS